MRIDRLDKLDRINFYQSMHSNLVKWWSFTMTDPDECIEKEEEELLTDSAAYDEDYDPDAMAEELLADALGEGSYAAEDPFAEMAQMDPEAAAAAMEVFNRLQAEAAADEAAKQAEIEAARALAGS